MNFKTCEASESDSLHCMWNHSDSKCVDYAPTTCADLGSRNKCDHGEGTLDCFWNAGECVEKSDFLGTDVGASCSIYLKKGACKRRENWPESEDAYIVCKWVGGTCSASSLKGCVNFTDAAQCESALATLLGCAWNSTLRACYAT